MKKVFTKRLISAILTTALIGTSAFALFGCGKASKDTSNDAKVHITNVSYDPTRELYESYNKIFADHWKAKTGQEVEVTQSHGGSGKQAIEVANGLEADVVTLALEYDVNAVRDAGLINDGWINNFENDSSPYTSTIVFLVRKGNPKNIKDWNDLIKDGVGVITPNPKTSGGARWNYLAAWAYADKLYNGDESKIEDFVKKLYQNVLVLDSGARGATTTFVENGQDGVGVITPNPKTSGGARWNYLAAWAYADKLYNGDESKIEDFVKKLYQNVLVLDSGARGATTTFVENGQGDVLLAWENEAYLSIKDHPDEYEIITPSVSILAQPSVAVVDEVVDSRGTREVATEYLSYLYSDEAQRIAGDNYYRPYNQDILKEYSDVFDLNINLVTISDFGGWDEAQKTHFADGGIFDKIYEK